MKMELIDIEDAVAVEPLAPIPGVCPRCSAKFKPRSNKIYCSAKCRKGAAQVRNPRDRVLENALKNIAHYERAGWLSYDANRMPPLQQKQFLNDLVERAKVDADTRRIVLDPKLLYCKSNDPIGKMGHDRKSFSCLNIAKMVDQFCSIEYGCNSTDAIKDSEKLPTKKNIEYLSKRKVDQRNFYCVEYLIYTDGKYFRDWLKEIRKDSPLKEPKHKPAIRYNDDFERITRVVEEAQGKVDALQDRIDGDDEDSFDYEHFMKRFWEYWDDEGFVAAKRPYDWRDISASFKEQSLWESVFRI